MATEVVVKGVVTERSTGVGEGCCDGGSGGDSDYEGCDGGDSDGGGGGGGGSGGGNGGCSGGDDLTEVQFCVERLIEA